jgi:hypothetical protein
MYNTDECHSACPPDAILSILVLMMDALSIDGKLTDCCNVEYLDILSCDMDH